LITILLADDHALLRNGLRTILEANADLAVVAEAADGATAVRLAAQLQPDIVLMDIEMPGMDGIEATAQVIATAPQTRVLMLTTFDLDDYVLRALRAGAVGFLLKATEPGELVRAVRACAAGEPQLAPTVTERILQTYISAGPVSDDGEVPKQVESLTPREVEVLRTLAHGLSNAEIAAQLFLSEATVKTHVTRILTKLQLRDRMQAAVLAYETGLVQPSHRRAP
jgi:DNA-binding NarL/FixJ family response regulator